MCQVLQRFWWCQSRNLGSLPSRNYSRGVRQTGHRETVFLRSPDKAWVWFFFLQNNYYMITLSGEVYLAFGCINISPTPSLLACLFLCLSLVSKGCKHNDILGSWHHVSLAEAHTLTAFPVQLWEWLAKKGLSPFRLGIQVKSQLVN